MTNKYKVALAILFVLSISMSFLMIMVPLFVSSIDNTTDYTLLFIIPFLAGVIIWGLSILFAYLDAKENGVKPIWIIVIIFFSTVGIIIYLIISIFSGRKTFDNVHATFVVPKNDSPKSNTGNLFSQSEKKILYYQNGKPVYEDKNKKY